MTAFDSPEVPDVKVIRHGSSGRTPAGPGGGAESNGSPTHMTGQVGPAARSSPSLRGSAITHAGRVISSRWRKSFARSCSLHGRATSPWRKHATSDDTHSG